MTFVLAVHSFRRGTGKTGVAANLAAAFALMGRRVAAVDADIRAPGLAGLFGLDEASLSRTLNDYILGRCEIEQAICPIAPLPPGAGPLWVVPASSALDEIARASRRGYRADLIAEGLETLTEQLALDTLVVDLHAGLDEESMLLTSLADSLALVTRNDMQDQQGTAVIIEVARRLEVPQIALVVNEVPSGYDLQTVAERIATTYACPVAGVLPYTEAMLNMLRPRVFVLDAPTHPLSAIFHTIAAALSS